MIRFFILQNKQGKTRLSKWYATAPEDSERIKMEADIYRVVSLRVRGNTNFIEVAIDVPITIFTCRHVLHISIIMTDLLSIWKRNPPTLLIFTPCQYLNFKLIYRRYAGLFFIYGVDVTDNELLLMETIHLFVELLDEYFKNVCEVKEVRTFWGLMDSHESVFIPY